MSTKLQSIFASLIVLVTPSIALACPGYHERTAACGGSSTAGYVGAVGIGLLAGMVSVVIESALKKRNK